MAYIVDCDYLIGGKPNGEPLEMDRRALVLRLARDGHTQAAKAWRDYRDLEPGQATAVAKHLDGTLTKAGGQGQAVADSEALRRAMLAEWANDADPSLRSSARAALAWLEAAR
jgi:hypothetical protein